MARKSNVDPLIAALIAKLPAGGDFPLEKRRAWLRMMDDALGVIYGGGPAIDQAPAPRAAKPAPAPPAPKPEPKWPFVIDTHGFVRKSNAKGKRVLPGEIDDYVHDMRGENGDMRTIIWADDSTGINGTDLTVVGA